MNGMNNEDGRTFAVEEVEAATPPRRARVEDAPVVEDAIVEAPVAPRERDYLTGFLAEKPPAENPHGPGGAVYEGVIEALKDIYDPEIPVNIYDLGLIYGVDVGEDGEVAVMMTLTTPHCPVAESMPGEVELRVASVPGVRDCTVSLVWDPPWDMAKMTDEARLELGML
jgi:FeS assembly SUF system protein